MYVRAIVMHVAQDTLPTDPTALRELVLALARERDGVIAERDSITERYLEQERRVLALQHERDRLAIKLRLRMKQMYGASTERLNDAQLALFATAIAEAQAEAAAESEAPSLGILVPAHRRRRSGGDRAVLSDDLPRELIVHDVPAEAKTCSCCGHEKILIHVDRREVLEYVPASMKVLVHERPVYCCGECRSISKAPSIASTLPIPKGLAGPGLLSAVIVGKYADHLPLYRLEGIFPRHGLTLPRQTLCAWLAPCADLAEPLVSLMSRQVLQSRIIQTDDTPVAVLDPGLGRSRQGRFWSYLGRAREDADRKYAVFEYSANREGKHPQGWLQDFKGYLQSDAFAGYRALHESGAIVEVGCWAHARRKFLEAKELSKEFCGQVLRRMQVLYAVEREATGKGLDAVARHALRQERSRPAVDGLLSLLREERERHLPKSMVRQAIEYMLGRPEAFTRYLEDGELEIDNNACERSLRAVAVGRKNWLFVGSDFGGERAAVFFTLLCSARLHELEPWAYLRDVLDTLARRRAAGDTSEESLLPLLPDLWRRAHPDKIVKLGR